jgi:hypothetical protein
MGVCVGPLVSHLGKCVANGDGSLCEVIGLIHLL